VQHFCEQLLEDEGPQFNYVLVVNSIWWRH